jgi:N-acetylmuramoyl-L-alanine amidase
MGGDAGSMLANVAGRGLGAFAALESLRSGGLANFMLNRQRFLTDPALRETLVGSPFASGFFQVGGERVSPGPQLIAAPPGFMGPTIPTPAGPAEFGRLPARWMPSLPPLAPAEFLKTETERAVRAGLESGDPVRVAQAKMALKIPLTAEEQAIAASAGGALQQSVQAATGAPATVSLDIPGGQLTIGSPYAGLGTSGFLDEGLARRAAAATGRVAVQTDRGWQLFDPAAVPGTVQTPAQGEMPLEELTPQLLPGQVPQATGRRDAQGRPLYQAVVPPKLPEPTPPPLKPLPGQPGYQGPPAPPSPAAPRPAPAAPAPPAPRAPTAGRQAAAGLSTDLPTYANARGFVFHHSGGETLESLVSTLQDRGLGSQYLMDRDGTIYAYAGAGARHMQPNDRWGGVAPGLSNKNAIGMEMVARDNNDLTPAQIASARRFMAERYPNLPVYGHGEVNPGHKQATEGMAVVNAIRSDRAAPVVEVAGRPGIFTSGVAHAAERPPGAVVTAAPAPPAAPPPAPARPAAPPAAPPPRPAPAAPPVVRPAPPPAPAPVIPPVAAPPPAPPPPLRPSDVIPGLPRPETRIGYPPPAPAEEAGAAPVMPPLPELAPAVVTPAVPQEPTQAQPLVVKRETQKGPEGERTLESAELPAEAATKAVGTLLNYRNYARRVLTAFPDPAERAKYVGWLNRPAAEVKQLASADRRFSDFKTVMAPFQLSFFDRGGAALSADEIFVLREGLPTGQERTAADFESKLAYFPDLVEEQLAVRLAQQRTPIEAQTGAWADQIQRDIDAARAARWQARGLGAPAPTAEAPAPPPAVAATTTTMAPPPPPPAGPAPPAAEPTAAAPPPTARPSGILPRAYAAVVAPNRSFVSLLPSIGGATVGGLGGAAGGAALGAMTGPFAPVAVPVGAVVGGLLGGTGGGVAGEAVRMGAEQLGTAEPIAQPPGERLTEAGIRGAAGEVIGAPFTLGGRLVARPFLRAAETLAPIVRGPAAPWRVTSAGHLATKTTEGGRVLANVLRDPEALARVTLTPENRQQLLAAWWRSNARGGRGGLVRAWDELPEAARENLAGKYRGDMEKIVAAARATTASGWKEIKTLFREGAGGSLLGYFGGMPAVGAALPVAGVAAARIPGLAVRPSLGLGIAGPWLRGGGATLQHAGTQAASAAGLR